MTATAVTVLCGLKEPGGTQVAVITPTWTVSIITDNTRHMLMVSTGITGKDTITPPSQSWDENQTSELLRTLRAEVPRSLTSHRKQVFEKEMFIKGLGD